MPVVEEGIFDDLLVELGILAAAVLAGIVHKEFALGDAGCAESVRLDDVLSGFQKAAMDVTDHMWLSQGEEVTIVQQVFCRVLESLSADISFLHAVGADGRAHRSIDDGDSFPEDLLKWMLVRSSHNIFDGFKHGKVGIDATLPSSYYSQRARRTYIAVRVSTAKAS